MIIGKRLDIQKTTDGFIDKVFLWFIPHSIGPNHVTILRFILVPIIYLLLRLGMFDMALIVFIIAACTDFIDGAMARTRNQITKLGKVIDPVADKFLIMSVLLYIGLDYWIVRIFIIFIIFELFAILMGVFFSFTVGRPLGANFFGKIKMILQSFSVGLFILGILYKNLIIINISEYILFVALIFAVASGLEHIRLSVRGFPKTQK